MTKEKKKKTLKQMLYLEPDFPSWHFDFVPRTADIRPKVKSKRKKIAIVY